MLRTTRRNRESASRKTLKRQVYAQTGGALWFTLDNDKDNTRLKHWADEIAEKVEKGILPESLKNLTNPDALPQQQLDAFIDAHRYQDTLLQLSTSIVKKIADIPVDLNIQTASTNITKITLEVDTLAKTYAYDVITFLKLDYPSPSTDKITYTFTEKKIRISDILLEPFMLKNMFINGIANIFIALKANDSDIQFLRTQSSNVEYKNIIKLYAEYWAKYVNKQCVEYTGSFLTGSFYLTQQKDEFSKEILYPKGGDSFFAQFADLVVKDINAIKATECKNYFYISSENHRLWADLVTDILKIYLGKPKIGIVDIIALFDTTKYTNKTPCPHPNGVSTNFMPSGTDESTILNTVVTPSMLLTQIDPPLLSFILHLTHVIDENEGLRMKQIEEKENGKLAEFKAKFGRA